MEKICNICGSNKIRSEKKMQRTGKPKDAKSLRSFAFVSYGRVYYAHTCECGNTWEEETKL